MCASLSMTVDDGKKGAVRPAREFSGAMAPSPADTREDWWSIVASDGDAGGMGWGWGWGQMARHGNCWVNGRMSSDCQLVRRNLFLATQQGSVSDLLI